MKSSIMSSMISLLIFLYVVAATAQPFDTRAEEADPNALPVNCIPNAFKVNMKPVELSSCDHIAGDIERQVSFHSVSFYSYYTPIQPFVVPGCMVQIIPTSTESEDRFALVAVAGIIKRYLTQCPTDQTGRNFGAHSSVGLKKMFEVYIWNFDPRGSDNAVDRTGLIDGVVVA